MGRRTKIQGLWSKFHGGSPTLVSGCFLLGIKLLLFFSSKQCTYTRMNSFPFLIYKLCGLTSPPLELSCPCFRSLNQGILCRVCNGELRDYTRDKWKSTMLFSSPGYNIEEPVILGSGNSLTLKVKMFLFSLQPTRARCIMESHQNLILELLLKRKMRRRKIKTSQK